MKRLVGFIFAIAFFIGVAQAQITSGDVYVDTDDGVNDADCGTGTGSDACATLSYAIGRIGTVTGAVTIHCKGEAADVTPVTITGKSTTAANYILIQADAADRHDGKWNTAKYRLDNASTDDSGQDYAMLLVTEPYVRLDGLQIGNTADTGNAHRGIRYDSDAENNEFRVSNTIIKGTPTSNPVNGIVIIHANANVNIFNTIIYGCEYGGAAGVGIYSVSATSVNLYSSTIIDTYRGVRRDSGTTNAVVIKNTYAEGSNAAYSGVVTLTTSASSDTTGTAGLQSIAVNTTQFVNVTGGSEDFHLAGTGSALYGVGTDTSGDSSPLNFTTDIDGETRSSWDIGADEYSSDAPASTVGFRSLLGVGK